MNPTDDHYRAGVSLGYLFAEADRHEHASFGAEENELRHDADMAREDSPSWRAFKLGIVRGYRQSVRTLRGGRWGT